WSAQQLGRRRENELAEKKLPKSCFAAVGTVGTKVRGRTRIGRFGASQSISGGSEIFVPGSPGQLGQKYVEDANRPVRPKQRTFIWDIGPKVRVGREKPKEPRVNGISPRVFTANRNKEARIGRFREICPRQFGTSGPKVREGREKLKSRQRIRTCH
ncbi:hypothetical protein KI387_002905, partial [Taxus chinensis]